MTVVEFDYFTPAVEPGDQLVHADFGEARWPARVVPVEDDYPNPIVVRVPVPALDVAAVRREAACRDVVERFLAIGDSARLDAFVVGMVLALGDAGDEQLIGAVRGLVDALRQIRGARC